MLLSLVQQLQNLPLFSRATKIYLEMGPDLQNAPLANPVTKMALEVSHNPKNIPLGGLAATNARKLQNVTPTRPTAKKYPFS